MRGRGSRERRKGIEPKIRIKVVSLEDDVRSFTPQDKWVLFEKKFFYIELYRLFSMCSKEIKNFRIIFNEIKVTFFLLEKRRYNQSEQITMPV